jgi:hypothetical protein
MSEVPDCVFHSSNSEGVPDLDLSLQGDVLDYPRQWGSAARTTDLQHNTITFWEDDYRFNALGTAVEHGHHWRKLWERPAKVWESKAPSFIEVNFSTNHAQPYYRALWQIAKKRHLSCLFQQMGKMRCWVDMNVSYRWADLNMLGVPSGWLAYATHYQKYYDLDLLAHQVELARDRAGTDMIKFAVFAHNQKVERYCQREGLIYCGEDWSARDASKKQKRLAALEHKVKIEPLHSEMQIQPIRPKRIATLEDWC